MADTKPDKSDHHELPNGEGFEQSDANIKAVFGVGIAVLIFTLCCAVVINVLYSYLDERGSRVVQPKTERAKDEPRVINDHEPPLQESPEADMREWRAKEDAHLHSYGWVSKEKNVVRIPIERAMKLTLERKLLPSSNRVQAFNAPTGTHRPAGTGLPLLDKEEVLRHSGDSNSGRPLPRPATAPPDGGQKPSMAGSAPTPPAQGGHQSAPGAH
ncbi:MAG: hypothetical protein SNJ67_01825 [Chloracidobacterium sp.]|uniref:Uncharacterized protein n=1 Tax=Chloracidobacterium validum TaxID=2821543 RepID=A0ABX8BCK5_9BACT|nr:hypothetical protein [Chloracidobacterium validum]QUW04647.1 hypothetical protein J8C06_12795 [Chloracidobacterium validum]